MTADEARYRPKRDWIARVLLAILAFSFIGAILTMTIGAALAPIPLIGLVGLLLMPFPTLVLYAGSATILYCLAMLALRAFGIERASVRWIVLAASLALPWLGGYWYAEAANRSAGVAEGDATPPGWSPVRIASAGSIAMIDSGEANPTPECNALCLSLLVTGSAREVIVASTRPKVERGARVSGIGLALKPDWRRCFSQLSDYLSVVRSYPSDRRQYFVDFGLDPYFARDLPRCLAQRRVQFTAGALPTLVTWRSSAEHKLDESKGVGWQPPYAEQRILLPNGRDDNRRWSRFGYRYAVPATIWPYGGNAGFGGTFSPGLMRIMLSTPSASALDGPSWWDMVAEPRGLAARATAILDSAVPDRHCIPEPGSCAQSEGANIQD